MRGLSVWLPRITRIRRMSAAFVAVGLLQACSINPSVPGGSTPEDFARAVNGKRYQFDMTGRVWVPSMAGRPVSPDRIPEGLMVALEPAGEHCRRSGGTPRFTALAATDYRVQLPQRILCLRGTTPLWSLELRYLDTELTPSAYLATTLRAQLHSADQYATTLKDEEARAQAQENADATKKERQATAEQERQRRIREQEAAWPARVTAFRANLKAGDRFEWTQPPGGGGPIVGVVVRVEGPLLVFVQFDNLTIAGQQTRYVPRTELVPFDGPTPNMRRTID